MKASKQTFINIAKKAKTPTNFLKKVREINCPAKLATWFFNEYGAGGELSLNQAVTNFLKVHNHEILKK